MDEVVEPTNVVVVKEKKEVLKHMWENVINRTVKSEQRKLKTAPYALKIVSIFVPEAAPVLTSISKFLKTDSGKKLTEVTSVGYEALGETLKGNTEEASNKLDGCLNLFTVDEVGHIAKDVRSLMSEIGGKSR